MTRVNVNLVFSSTRQGAVGTATNAAIAIRVPQKKCERSRVDGFTWNGPCERNECFNQGQERLEAVDNMKHFCQLVSCCSQTRSRSIVCSNIYIFIYIYRCNCIYLSIYIYIYIYLIIKGSLGI